MAGKDSKKDANGGGVRQSAMPRIAIAKAISVPQAIMDNFAGKPVAPHSVAQALDMSPTSSMWRDLASAALAYGLVDGGWNATSMGVTAVGRRIVAPTNEGDDGRGMIEAVLFPSIPKAFFERYNRAKFPPEKIARNVLAEMGLPLDRADEAYKILEVNGRHVGIVTDTKTGPFVALDAQMPVSGRPPAEEAPRTLELPTEDREEFLGAPLPPTPASSTANNRVFVGHGKNKHIVGQLKDLLTFGKFVPVVADEQETPSRPIPEKVLDSMRSCFAGIIHVASEQELLDAEGKAHHKLNDNVLIEIGAAMALYKKNFILLVQKGVTLPSNLQGLYRCDYEGDKLDYDATMKLLKAFNEFERA